MTEGCRCPECRTDSDDPLVRFARWVLEMKFDQIETAHPQRILRGIAVRAEQALAERESSAKGAMFNNRNRRPPL